MPAPSRHPLRSALAAGAIVVATGAVAVGVLPQQQGTVDLLTQANVTVMGAETGVSSGYSVAAAGDVNGDGLADVIVGAHGSAPLSRAGAGSAYVIYGQASPSEIDLAALGSRGFRIDGAAVGDQAGYSVATAGDVNGDGRADVIVGAYTADPASRASAGSTYVIYGQASPSDVDLAALGSRGFRIDGAALGDQSGWSVASAGDVNGDGLVDVIVGAKTADPSSRSSAGSTYVIYGQASPADVDLAAVGSRGFRIDGAATGDGSGYTVASAGDVNGDGRADVIVGAPGADPLSRSSAGSTYVIYGGASPSDVDLASLGSRGFRIDGAALGDQSGGSVASAGDVNGDSLVDVIVGAKTADPASRSSAGSTYVIYGQASPANLDLAAVGSRGFRIDGAALGDSSGHSVASAGDVNGDGRADVIVGAPTADPLGRTDAGSTYVIYGQASPTDVDLAAVGSRGFRIDGAALGDESGYAVGSSGDVNGDGRPDVIVGASTADPLGRTDAGTSYVIDGFGVASVAYPGAITGTVGTAITGATPSIRRTGAATFSASAALPPGLGIDAATGRISGTPTQEASGTFTVTMTDLSGTASTTVSVNVNAAAAPESTSATTPATPATLRVRVSCRGVRCVSTGTVPRGATRIAQTARSTTKRVARGVCRITTARPTTGARPRFTCRVRLAGGRWTITTVARDQAGINAMSVTRVTVRAQDR